jgi:hypothetical protein
MHKSAMKCNKTLGKWCKNKHEASKIMDTLETYQEPGQSRGVEGVDYVIRYGAALDEESE